MACIRLKCRRVHRYILISQNLNILPSFCLPFQELSTAQSAPPLPATQVLVPSKGAREKPCMPETKQVQHTLISSAPMLCQKLNLQHHTCVHKCQIGREVGERAMRAVWTWMSSLLQMTKVTTSTNSRSPAIQASKGMGNLLYRRQTCS